MGYSPASSPTQCRRETVDPGATWRSVRSPHVVRPAATSVLGVQSSSLMSHPSPASQWLIDLASSWPPRGRPKPPFGPTMVEILRSCPLRGCFEASRGYERRISFSGRLGTAFHRVLQSLLEEPPESVSLADMAAEARRRFHSELQRQEAQASLRFRERHLTRDQSRADAAVEAVMAEAQRMAREGLVNQVGAEGLSPPSSENDVVHEPLGTDEPHVEVEVRVRSDDGLFEGIVDRAERLPEGTRIVDFKAALRDDLTERYARQVQLYALMWRETRGEWPVAGEVVYPMRGIAHVVSVAPDACLGVGNEARDIVRQLQRATNPAKLGLPGDVCKACDFRPWCEVFWGWQRNEPSQIVARQRAGLGIEGPILSLASVDQFWKVVIAWRNCQVGLVAPRERFPQLEQVAVGSIVRLLDIRLHGAPHRPHAITDERSEIFIVSGR
jgi:hypothetical protein